MNTFCTIITADYFPYALTLYKSLKKFDADVILQVLVCDLKPGERQVIRDIQGIKIVYPAELYSHPLMDSIYNKYAHLEMDAFRWAVKPIFITVLTARYKKVIYVDSDIYFYQDFSFLFDELDHASILLTPHWRNAYPLLDEKGFYSLFTDGIFNAGFIGASKGSEEALTWWAEACHFKMGSHHDLGIQDDQRYLDIFPVRFEGVKIIKHKGCNVSGYNKIECKRELVDGEVLINGVYPIIFIHYNKDFIAEILKGYDDLLLPYFKIFKQTFELEGVLLGSVKQGLNYYLEPGNISKLKWKLRVRTRIKALLTRLGEII